jgi:hypothetical protein
VPAHQDVPFGVDPEIGTPCPRFARDEAQYFHFLGVVHIDDEVPEESGRIAVTGKLRDSGVDVDAV